MSVTDLDSYNAINWERMQLDQSTLVDYPKWTIRLSDASISRDNDWINVEKKFALQTPTEVCSFLEWTDSLEHGKIHWHKLDKTDEDRYTDGTFNPWTVWLFVSNYLEGDETLHVNYDDDEWDPQHRDINLSAMSIWSETSGYDTTWDNIADENTETYSSKTRSSWEDQSSWWDYDHIITFLVWTDI